MAEKVELFLLNDGYEKHSSGDNLIYSKNGKKFVYVNIAISGRIYILILKLMILAVS